MSRTVFVIGTGTDVGKTMVSAAIAYGAHRQGLNTRYWKPVQTGEVRDSDTVKRLTQEQVTIVPTTFAYAAPQSPDQAALREAIPAPTIREIMIQTPAVAGNECLVIESAGGLFVPLNQENETWRDLIHRQMWPVVLVTSSQLGTLNHTSLTLEALAHIQVVPHAVVVNGPKHPENIASLRRLYPQVRFIEYPRLPEDASTQQWQQAADQLWSALAMPTHNAVTGSDCLQDDLKYIWHPYTQHANNPDPLVIQKAQGVWLTTDQGEKLLDATSSWWVNNIGHGRPEINHAMTWQQRELDHCIFAGATHEPATLLARKLVSKTGDRLSRVFYTDNGSCAVEVALKMALQSWVNRGEPHRTKIVGLAGGYHGDTFGAMAAAGSETFHSAFERLLFPALKLTPATSHASAYCPHGKDDVSARIAELDAQLDQHQADIAAIIVEPMLQGAGGMLVQDLRWLQHLRRRTRELGIILIFDEVFTGMGRIGDYFSFNRFPDIEPDIACIAKGLTGGTMPLAATLASEEIFRSFLGDSKRQALLHGHSFTANPIGCRVALAALSIIENEGLCEKARALESVFEQWLTTSAPRMNLQAPRTIGAMMAFELPDTTHGQYFSEQAAKIPQRAREQGLFLRTLGNTIYVVPPLTINAHEQQQLLDSLSRTIA